jgi:thiamine pyrophosphate-dependent acetolactate synthase large subunit-like protein
MHGDKKQINVPALAVLAILAGGTVSVAGIKFSWVPTDASVSRDEIKELRIVINKEMIDRQQADAAIIKEYEEVYRELIILQQKLEHLTWRCSRLERRYKDHAE